MSAWPDRGKLGTVWSFPHQQPLMHVFGVFRLLARRCAMRAVCGLDAELPDAAAAADCQLLDLGQQDC
jgi:hypothetical protein